MKREKKKSTAKVKSVKKAEIKVQNDENKPQIKLVNYLFNIWTPIVLIIIIGIVAFNDYIFADHLFFFKDIGSDSLNQKYPGIVHLVQLYNEGIINKWTFYKGMGQSGFSGLPTDPYSLFRKAIDIFSISLWKENYLIYGWFIRDFIFSFLLSGIIFYYYLRTISIKGFAATIGSILIAFSGFIVVGSGWDFSSHVFKGVFLLFAFEQLYVKKRWYFFPFAVIYLSSNIYVLYIYSFFLLAYSIFRFVGDAKGVLNSVKVYSQMVILGTIGLLMNMVNGFNSFQKLFNSPRVTGNASYSQYLTEGIDITNQANIGATTVLRTFSSDILGTGSNFKGWNNYLEAPLFYIGLLTLLILPQVFVYLNKRKKIVFGTFLGFWMLTLVFPYLRYTILAYTGDYFRYGFDFFIPFTFLFYAVYALNKIVDEDFKINFKLLGATLVILLILLFFPYASIKVSVINNQVRMVLMLFLLGYTGLLILFSMPQYRNYSQLGIILLIVIELSFSSFKSYEKRVPVTKREFKRNKAGYADGTIKAIDYIKSIDQTPFYRTEKDYNSGSAEHTSLNDALAQGYYGTASYSSFNQLNYIRFLEETEVIKKGNEIQTRWAPGFRGYPLLQTFGSVKYHLSKSDNPGFKRFGFDSIATVDSVKILKNRYHLPFGYTYDKYINFEDFLKLSLFAKQLALLNGFVYEDDKFTNLKVKEFSKLNTADSLVFVSESRFNFQLYQNFTDSLKKDTLAINSFKQDRILGSIRLSKPKVLFFTIPYDEGWKVKVNGQEQKLSRINVGFTGLELPTGEHQIELYFAPKYYVLTLWISWTSVALFWLYLGYYFFKNRRKGSLN